MAIVVVELQPTPGLARSLDEGATIGRAEECTVRLGDPTVSRRHAAIVGGRSAPVIADLDSANGLYVNGERCRGEVRLRVGDVVQLGGTIWMVASS